MKKIITLLVVSLTIFSIYAQNDLLVYQYQNINGKNHLTNDLLLANEYVFADRIEQYYIDTISNTITLQLRGVSKNGKWLNGSGNFLLFDLQSDRIKWDKKINYNETSILQSNDIIIETSTLGSNYLNPDNGLVQSRTKIPVNFISSNNKIGIGYETTNFDGYQNNLVGVELTSGSPLWKREISHEYGWNEETMLNDSVLLLVSDGLHSINLKTGFGWDFKAKTGGKDYTATVVTNVLGVAIAVLTGVLVYSAEPDIITNLTSNVVSDSSGIYYASRENISRFDMNGKLIWVDKLEKNKVSNSTLIIRDSMLYMINRGNGLMNNNLTYIGKSFFSGYNKLTGNQIFYSQFDGVKNLIKDFKVIEDTIFFALNDRVLKYSMITGDELASQPFGIKEIGEFTSFADKNLYLMTDSVFENLTGNSEFYFLKTKNDKLLVLNKQLEISRLIDLNEIYTCYLTIGNLRFLAKGDETYILDKENNIVATINASQYAKLIGTKLIDIHESSVIEIELGGVLKLNKMIK